MENMGTRIHVKRRRTIAIIHRTMRRASTALSGALSSARAADDDADDAFAAAPVEILPKEINLTGDADDKLPNTLVITVIQARNLQTAALRSTLSCYVKLSSLGREFKTSVISKNDEPYWNETYSFRAIDWASSVTLSVRDKINVKMRFLGQLRIACTDVANLPGMATQSWFRLRDKNWERKAGMDAELELKVALVYTKKNDPTIVKNLAATAGIDMDDELVGIVADQDDETEEEAIARRKELERLEQERNNTQFANIKQGDYQIQVHVIEARDLKGENLSGTSDPYVQVEIAGTKKKTSTKYETLGCVFDEILFFHFKNLGRHELKQASITLSIYDKETVMKDKLIGSYQLDCLTVYFRPHHELYRQWVAVHDHLSTKDRGIQGFLLISITVIGPGDTFLVHDRDAELARELALASGENSNPSPASVPSDGPSLVLLPPTIDLQLQFLVVKVFKAEDLPPMDQGGLLVASGIDAFVQVSFGSAAVCRSSVVTVKGSAHLAPEFMEELWIPVMSPTLSRHIAVSVWDRDLGRKDELVALAAWDFQQVVSASAPGGILAPPPEAASTQRRRESLTLLEEKESAAATDRVELRWLNLYGPPLKRVNKQRAAWLTQHTDQCSTYRGRVLLSMERVECPAPEEGDKFHVKRITTANLVAIEPKTLKYVLRCAVFCGADLPHASSSSLLPGSTTTMLRVSVSIGPHELLFEPMPVDKLGRVHWEECKDKWPIILPSDLTQLPDIVFTLSRLVDKDTFVSVAFARLPVSQVLGFDRKCEWIHLHEETARRQTKYALDKAHSPGALLVRIGFGREEVAVRSPWGDDASQFAAFRHHRVHREIRVHVFQVRKLQLPPSKSSVNPFVTVHCCGQQKKTLAKYKTLDPLFYETLSFVVHVPHEPLYSPDVVLKVRSDSVILGELRLPIRSAVHAMANAGPARPTWHPLKAAVSTGTELVEEAWGEALVSMQYVDLQSATQTVFPIDPKALQPEYEDATLEIIALGVRKLKPRSLLGLRRPQIEFALTGGVFADGRSTVRTQPAVATSGKNVNVLERLVLPVRLPVDTLFAPQLSVRVVEASLGGLRSAVVAESVVALAAKMPWSGEYIAPTPQAFTNPAVGSSGGAATISQSRRKSALELLGLGRWRRKSQTKEVVVDKPLEGEEEGEEIYSDEDGGEGDSDEDDDKVVEGEPVELDDGLGVGAYARPQWAATPSLQDPAVQEQLAREERRRYAAGHADLLRGGGSGGAAAASGVYFSGGGGDGGGGEYTTTPYLEDRDWWIKRGGESLEKYLQTPALETYPLYRSVLTRPSFFRRQRVRVQVKAGVFKGVIRVREKRSKRDDSESLDLERLREPQALVVRVYVLKGSSLQAKDLNGYSDPYLRLKLGKVIISDRANHKTKTLHPDFFQLYTFNTTLPGASQLEIQVWDHDMLTTDDYIGSTTIDLEDRWFHRDWQRLGPVKPIEHRHLFTPKRSTSQGMLQLWVDILTAQQAATQPPVDIQPPVAKKFEVRVVVWRAENVTDKEQSEVNDYFVKVWMEGGKPETTDVHWRCSNGKPCWNWRFTLPVEYPLRTPEFARLHVQLWDKDVVKWNDVIGEAQLDLYKWIRRCYDTNRAVAPFEELKTLAKGGTSAKGTEIVTVVGDETGGGEREEEEGEEADDGEDDEDEEGEEEEEEMVTRGTGSTESHALLQRNQPAKKKKTNALAGKVKKPKFLDKQAQQRAKSDKKKTKEARESNEARLALNGLLDFIGMGNLPDDAEWVTIYYTDRESGVSTDMGRLGISIQIVPEKEAQMNPVGKGQESPNVNPYLPPPVGRMRLTANPVMMLKELVGPKMCIRLALCCCCIGCVLFFGVFGATIMSTLTFFETMSSNSQTSNGVAYHLNDWPNALNGTVSGQVTVAPVSSQQHTPKPPVSTAPKTAQDSSGSGSE